MPKLKTNRGAAKRFKKTGSGKIKHKQSFTSHLLTHKSSKRKRQLRSQMVLKKADQRLVERLLPNH